MAHWDLRSRSSNGVGLRADVRLPTSIGAGRRMIAMREILRNRFFVHCCGAQVPQGQGLSNRSETAGCASLVQYLEHTGDQDQQIFHRGLHC